MGLPLKKSLVSFRKEMFLVFQMSEYHLSAWVTPLLESDAEIFERCVIGVESASIGSKYTDVLRRQIQNLLKFCFLFADFFFRTFTFLDFYTGAVPLDDLSRFVTLGLFTMQEPTIFPVSPSYARLG